jgi:hypothetical protein
MLSLIQAKAHLEDATLLFDGKKLAVMGDGSELRAQGCTFLPRAVDFCYASGGIDMLDGSRAELVGGAPPSRHQRAAACIPRVNGGALHILAAGALAGDAATTISRCQAWACMLTGARGYL